MDRTHVKLATIQRKVRRGRERLAGAEARAAAKVVCRLQGGHQWVSERYGAPVRQIGEWRFTRTSYCKRCSARLVQVCRHTGANATVLSEQVV